MFLFLVALCLAVAVEPCIECISIKKKIAKASDEDRQGKRTEKLKKDKETYVDFLKKVRIRKS